MISIFYITYWAANDPLSKGSAWPFLKTMLSRNDVDRIYYVTIERNEISDIDLPKWMNARVTHVPISVPLRWPEGVYKIIEFLRVRQLLLKRIKDIQVHLVVARCSPTSIYAIPTSQKTGVPLIMESFEPHTDDMILSGIWKRFSMRSLVSKHYEERAKEYASFLITVSHLYADHLVSEGLSASKIETIPCTVPLNKFKFDEGDRLEVRKRLHIPLHATVGIYSGKFGGRYYDHEAFDVFKGAFEQSIFDEFYLILLTSDSIDAIYKRLERFHIPKERVHVCFVDHQEVPAYLSAADFAFSMLKSNSARKYCSPIKNGEYWASGLPIFCTDGIGDDVDIIQLNRAGVVLSIERSSEVHKALLEMKSLIKEPGVRQRMMEVALEHRSEEQIERIYDGIFQRLGVANAEHHI